MVEILGERGSHTRAAVAVTGLPKDSTVEITAIFSRVLAADNTLSCGKNVLQGLVLAIGQGLHSVSTPARSHVSCSKDGLLQRPYTLRHIAQISA